MARLALLTLLLVALCRVIDGEAAASPYYSAEPEEAVVLPDSNGGGAYIAGTPVAVVPADLDAPAGEEAAVLQNHVLPERSEKVSVSPADDDADRGFLRVPCNRHCRYRYMRWARRHGRLHQQDVYGFHRHGDVFHAQEKQLVADVPIEPATHGEERREEEEEVLPVAEPDPDSHQDAAAVAAEELVQKPTAVHGEEGGEHDEMARAWGRFHHGRRFHHHHCHQHHQDNKHEEDDDHERREEVSLMKRFRFHRRRHHHHEEEHEQAEEVSPVKRFRLHHDDDDDEEKSEMRIKRFHHHHHHHDKDELEEMARRWIRKALTRGRMPHHDLRFRHREEEAAGGEGEEGGVMRWIKDLVNRF